MIEAEIITPWVRVPIPESEGEMENVPLINAKYNTSTETKILRMEDRSGTPSVELPPRVNTCVVLIHVEDVDWPTIRDDPDIHVLWADRVGTRTDRDKENTPQEWNALRTYMQNAGLPANRLDDATGPGRQLRSKIAVTQTLRHFTRELGKTEITRGRR